MLSEPNDNTAETQIVIRAIALCDNAQVEALILNTLTEFGCVGPGFASSDPEVKDMYTVYQTPSGQPRNRGYWVIIDKISGLLLGGGGFSRLKCTTPEESICELQKVYFRPELRGKGFGRKMIELCIEKASLAGYRTMYLETTPQMQSALGLYEKLGFCYIHTYLGDTGHRGCTVFMSRPLQPIASSQTVAQESLSV